MYFSKRRNVAVTSIFFTIPFSTVGLQGLKTWICVCEFASVYVFVYEKIIEYYLYENQEQYSIQFYMFMFRTENFNLVFVPTVRCLH